jgi:hypothetical protein
MQTKNSLQPVFDIFMFKFFIALVKTKLVIKYTLKKNKNRKCLFVLNCQHSKQRKLKKIPMSSPLSGVMCSFDSCWQWLIWHDLDGEKRRIKRKWSKNQVLGAISDEEASSIQSPLEKSMKWKWIAKSHADHFRMSPTTLGITHYPLSSSVQGISLFLPTNSALQYSILKYLKTYRNVMVHILTLPAHALKHIFHPNIWREKQICKFISKFPSNVWLSTFFLNIQSWNIHKLKIILVSKLN